MLAATGLLVVGALSQDAYVVAATYAVLGLAVSWWMSPWQGFKGARQSDVEALATAESPVVIYWRPGCVFCARLRARLGRTARHALWVNIWEDPDAAAFVRSVNEGNETVPTVVIGGEASTNPDPTVVRNAISARS